SRSTTVARDTSATPSPPVLEAAAPVAVAVTPERDRVAPAILLRVLRDRRALRADRRGREARILLDHDPAGLLSVVAGDRGRRQGDRTAVLDLEPAPLGDGAVVPDATVAERHRRRPPLEPAGLAERSVARDEDTRQ